ncbi:hypothetical protein PICST_28031 [Scheffersomyces stipitis CBS 6054]|uniref:Genetic interactor of prohibitins 3, mitochondrial n=1 Tax=Scheffersomyces stipitis (strain ATCC 58785 / CBS 6054 / NBRC 10063 / NRRL Y-11545) TaxID=322104 RepID=GEP3_PICST|nr:predicted protein [Scheffersomyces stipitis CBS 6054]A3GEW8.2 RecName: Full=Genetic interactor of prohibitins 3, mitochondrial; AltName: Full=Found in mitochondrial proteome protein 38; Flags: Precursor [Scheffersomyces stipitis CBS 6054]EAZ63239.2 hypothetical protein PICST_28031 [Scheffersomyces stipitis CBS 6054]
MIRYSGFSVVRSCLSRTFSRNNSALSTAITSSLLTNLFPTCKSCGVRLQSSDPKGPGYYILEESKPAKRFVKSEDQVFAKYVNDLSLEDKKLLINEDSKKVSDSESRSESQDLSNEADIDSSLVNSLGNKDYYASEIKKVSQKDKFKLEEKYNDSVECVRCRDATYRSNFKNFSQQEYPLELLDNIMSRIPPHEQIVYIVNAQDFPMSINPKIFQYRSSNELKFIVNKADLLFKSINLSKNYGQTFFSDYLFHKYRVPKENVMVVSGTNYWDFDKVLDFVDDNSYLIGNVNCGKSTIIKGMLYTIDKSNKRKKFMSSRERTKMEKEQDMLINRASRMKAMTAGEKKKEKKRYEMLFRSKVGPGVSHIPGFTRGFIQIDLEDMDKTIYDVPGFVNSENQLIHHHDIYNKISSPKILKQIHKGVKVYDKGTYTSKYITAKGGQSLTIGGLFFLNFPQKSMYQLRNCINHDFHLFSNFSRAVYISSNLSKYPGMGSKFFIEHDDSSLKELRRFIIPPFHGSIDLVIQNLGHINIKPTGRKETNQPLILYLPPGVEAIIRLPITNYIAKTFTGRDAKGNPLRKENILTKGVLALQRYTAKYPFYSTLISANKGAEVSSELALILKSEATCEPVTDAEQERLVKQDFARIGEWATIARGVECNYNERTVVDERNKFDYWME